MSDLTSAAGEIHKRLIQNLYPMPSIQVIYAIKCCKSHTLGV